MKAWIIKTKKGYVGHSEGGQENLIDALIYPTKRKAKESQYEGDEIIPIEIKLIKKKKGKTK